MRFAIDVVARFAAPLLVAVPAVAQPDTGRDAGPDAERTRLLEDRRSIIAERLAEIDAELAGDVPPGTVRLFGVADRPGGGRMPSLAPLDGRRGELGEHSQPRPGRGASDPADREAMLERLAEIDPDLAETLRAASARGNRAGGPVFSRLRTLLELRDRDREAFDVRRAELRAGVEVLRKAGGLRDLVQTGASQAEIDQAEGRLRDAIAVGFDAKAAVLRHEIERTTSRLDDMQRKLDETVSRRESIIAEHAARLLERVRTMAMQEPSPEPGSGDD